MGGWVDELLLFARLGEGSWVGGWVDGKRTYLLLADSARGCSRRGGGLSTSSSSSSSYSLLLFVWVGGGRERGVL